MIRKLLIIIAAVCAFALNTETIYAEGEDVADSVILVLKNGEEKILDGCLIDGPYFCNNRARFCVHENNIKAMKGNTKYCGGTGIVGNLPKDLIQGISDASGISDWFKKACEVGIKELTIAAKGGRMLVDTRKDKLETITLVEGDSPAKSGIDAGKTYMFTYDAKYSSNRQLRLSCLINTRIWIYYIHQ